MIGQNDIQDVNYQFPLGKNNHIANETETLEGGAAPPKIKYIRGTYIIMERQTFMF